MSVGSEGEGCDRSGDVRRVGFAHRTKPDSRDRGGARPRTCVLRRHRAGTRRRARRRARRDDACSEAQADDDPDDRTELLRVDIVRGDIFRVDILVVELDILAARLDLARARPGRPLRRPRPLLPPQQQQAAAKARAVAKAKAAAKAKRARAAAAKRAAIRAKVAKQKAAARKAQEQRQALAAATALANADENGASGTLSLIAKVILGLAAILVLLALAPARAVYAIGPRAGETLDHGRVAIAGAGVAIVVGMLIALGLGGVQ